MTGGNASFSVSVSSKNDPFRLLLGGSAGVRFFSELVRSVEQAIFL